MFDIGTLMIIIVLVASVSALILFMLWRIDTSRQGVFLWFLASLLNVFAYSSPLAFSAIARSGEGVFLNNIVILTSTLLLLEGALRFRDYQSSWRWLFAPVILPVLAVIAWLFREDAASRYAWLDPVSVSVFIGIAVIMVYRTDSRQQLKVYGLTASFCLFMAVLLTIRWVLAIRSSNDLEAQAFNPYMLVGFILFTLGWTYSIMLACYQRAYENILHLAREDALTGLPNRRSIDETLNREILRSTRTGNPFALIVLDLNDFKLVNDQHGHLVGDELLQTIALRLKDRVRDADFVGRFGGDEFLVILHDAGTEPDRTTAMHRLQSYLREPYQIQGNELRVGVSAGLSVFGQDGESADEMLRSADRRMYRDKT